MRKLLFAFVLTAVLLPAAASADCDSDYNSCLSTNQSDCNVFGKGTRANFQCLHDEMQDCEDDYAACIGLPGTCVNFCPIDGTAPSSSRPHHIRHLFRPA